MLDKINDIAKLIGSIGVLAGVIIAVVAWVRKINNAMKCLLRSQMLDIYYKYKDDKQIPQYCYESFELLYAAYTALHGNSFMQKIHDNDVTGWEVIR